MTRAQHKHQPVPRVLFKTRLVRHMLLNAIESMRSGEYTLARVALIRARTELTETIRSLSHLSDTED